MYRVESLKTRYGTLTDVTYLTKYENGICKDCMVETESTLLTRIGKLVPKYSVSHARTKQRNAVEFYPSGALKSVYLEDSTMVMTSLGKMEAEMVTFYESGEVLRVFPRYGQISGYWSEEEERALLLPVDLSWCGISGLFRVSCFCFYKSGRIKSMTFYPGEEPVIWRQGEKLPVRIGLAFYESGEIKSLEPALECRIQTPIGEFTAYDSLAYGIHGDANSLELNENGSVQKLRTVMDKIMVYGKADLTVTLRPQLRPSQMDPDQWEVVPLQVEFTTDEVLITVSGKSTVRYSYEANSFEVLQDKAAAGFSCSGNCSACSTCSA